MSEPPDEELTDETVLLLRRASNRSLDPQTRGVRADAFRLRPSHGEEALSFFDSRRVSAAELLDGAPSPGWGVAAISVKRLRDAGFKLVSDGSAADGPQRGHVSAYPGEVDGGQIPHGVRRALALAARWAIEPEGA